MKTSKIALIAAASIGLAACQNPNGGTDWTRTIATGAGAVGGILVGSMFGQGNGRLVAMAIGGAAGAWLGNELGSRFSAREAAAMKPAVASAASSRDAKPVSWQAENENGEISRGEITPAGPIRIVDGKECRSMRQSVERPSGRTTETFDVCRPMNGGGDWQVASAK